MKINNYQFPKSSFLSIEKDYALIVDKILNNNRLKKLLFYTDRNALKQPELTPEQDLILIQQNIKILPKIYNDTKIKNYLVINFDDFTPNDTNPEFRDNHIIFDIVCHIDCWDLGDFQLRPFKIAGELDSMFNEKKLTGIGKLELMHAGQLPNLGDDWFGFCLMYQTIHGEEDKQGALNPEDWEQFVEEFDESYNS